MPGPDGDGPLTRDDVLPAGARRRRELIREESR